MTATCNLQTARTACLVFLGCPKNQVDSEHVLGSLTEAGYSLTTDARSADLIVITTCAFLQSAVRESETAIEEALKLKQESSSNPETDIDATKARKTRNGQGKPPINTDNRADVSGKARGKEKVESGKSQVRTLPFPLSNLPLCVHPCPSVVSRSRRPASCFRGSPCPGSGSKKVVVAGCLVERYGRSLKRKFPAVDLWVPLRDMPRIPELLPPPSSLLPPPSGESAIYNLESRICNRPVPSSRVPRSERSSSCSLQLASCTDGPRVLSTPPHFAYLKIADGCDNRCSYCMIPDIRGPFRSRPLHDVTAEARALARAGVKELILVAQDTTLYGTDFRTGAHHKDTKTQRERNLKSRLSASRSSCLLGSTSVSAPGQSRLAELLAELGRIDGIRWLRLMYTHPAHITEDVIDQFASNPKLCRYIDLPIQHVADHLLEKMNRRYTRQDVELLLESLRTIPDMHIRTTIIVGLPGETAHDFEQLLAFIRAARFDRLSCYAYSPEPGTKAARLPGQVSPAVKEERVRRLMLAQAAISRANLKKLVGRKLNVLVDSVTENRQERQGRQGSDLESATAACKLQTVHSREARARTEWDAPEIDGVVRLFGRKVRVGAFVRALVTSSSTHDLTALTL